ncbi:ABC-three component system middle component 8 [uncultured Bacteroides sp.]|uniref:ABC-three component system middle component 8 n=1 Tax=uncultured Bacteroides sp. TaxID=162156 RepID=UPI002AA83D12|nr:ABC-three component system middle component 8 [uncultured Bacteroides sp.]
MIAPNKYLDLDLSVINLGGIILSILKKSGMTKYDDLLDRVMMIQGEKSKEMFLPSLSFLFLLGKIQYNKSLDIIELKP